MAPYNVTINPFPSSPTPTLSSANILGGKRHIAALNSIKDCLNELNLKLNSTEPLNEDLF